MLRSGLMRWMMGWFGKWCMCSGFVGMGILLLLLFDGLILHYWRSPRCVLRVASGRIDLCILLHVGCCCWFGSVAFIHVSFVVVGFFYKW